MVSTAKTRPVGRAQRREIPRGQSAGKAPGSSSVSATPVWSCCEAGFSGVPGIPTVLWFLASGAAPPHALCPHASLALLLDSCDPDLHPASGASCIKNVLWQRDDAVPLRAGSLFCCRGSRGCPGGLKARTAAPVLGVDPAWGPVGCTQGCVSHLAVAANIHRPPPPVVWIITSLGTDT